MSDPHRDIPRDPDGRPDDRFDATDSGPDGWDTPYPPGTDAPPGPGGQPRQDLPDDHPAAQATGGAGPARPEPREPKVAVDPDSYEADGPDEPADTPQR